LVYSLLESAKEEFTLGVTSQSNYLRLALPLHAVLAEKFPAPDCELVSVNHRHTQIGQDESYPRLELPLHPFDKTAPHGLESLLAAHANDSVWKKVRADQSDHRLEDFAVVGLVVDDQYLLTIRR
jgi:hypothetical protein